MKTGTIPFPRSFGPGDSGIDCRAVKRALAKAAHAPQGMSLKTLTFSKPAQVALVSFKTAHGLLADPIYTLQAHEKLRPFFDEYGAAQMAKKAVEVVAAAQRAAYVATWRWAITHNYLNDYAEVRPIPEGLSPFETSDRIKTDCSGEVEIDACWSKLSDPSGLGFNGQGNTGSILHYGTWITPKQAQPGDHIVYRSSSSDMYGHHVVAILDVLPGDDFEIGTNGRQGDPRSTTHSTMLAGQASEGYPVATFVRWLPAQ